MGPALYNHPYAKHGLGLLSDMPGAAVEDQESDGERHQGVGGDR